MTTEEEEYKIHEEKEPELITELKNMLSRIEIMETARETNSRLDICMGILLQMRGLVAADPPVSMKILPNLEKMEELAYKIIIGLTEKKEHEEEKE